MMATVEEIIGQEIVLRPMHHLLREDKSGGRTAGCVERIKEANKELPSVGNRSNPVPTEGFVRFGVSLRWERL